MAKRKLADDLASTNTEFEKRKSDRPDDETPRENPQRQAPGTRGLRRPRLETWTTEELRSAAAELQIEGAAALDRSELIERLLSAERRTDTRDAR
jgi:hypothetical protein